MRQVSPVNLAVIFVVKLFLGNRSSKSKGFRNTNQLG